VDGVSTTKGQTGHSSRGPGDGGSRDHWKELDRCVYFFLTVYESGIRCGDLYEVVLGFLTPGLPLNKLESRLDLWS